MTPVDVIVRDPPPAVAGSWLSVITENDGDELFVLGFLGTFTVRANLEPRAPHFARGYPPAAAPGKIRGMCHDDDSRPPAPPFQGEVAARADLRLTAADGNRLLAHGARAGTPIGTGVVVMPDVRGLHAYRELAARFAETGLDALAIDYFGRTADTDDRTESFEFMPHVEQTTAEGVAADVAAGVSYLRSKDGGAVARVFTVGFCFGGARSWAQSADTPGLDGCIGFYGRPALAQSGIDRMTAPLLLLMAGADVNISPADAEAFAARVRARGLRADVHVYDGAPHSFFDRSFAEHRGACDDAWHRILEFVGRPV
jgi:carboxymethylenebutenolidase